MAAPYNEPGPIAALRTEAAVSGDQRLQTVSNAVGALWSAIEGLHSANETAHAALTARLDTVATFTAGLDDWAGGMQADDIAIVNRLAQMHQQPLNCVGLSCNG